MLISAKAAGADFTSVVTLGRQWMFVDPALLKVYCQRLGKLSPEQQENLEAKNGFGENFLHILGSKDPQSMDASDYEQATIVHDLNQPIPQELQQKFDAVIDGGTLEHVFNFPVAVRNAMEMTKVGGRLFLFTPGNNFMGHGFYQFSPELLYRVLSPANGFQVERMLAKEMGSTKFFEVADPDSLKHRVALVNHKPVVLMVQAKRLAAVPIFARTPQQSDYVESWHGNTEASAGKPPPKLLEGVRRTVMTIVPARTRLFLRRIMWEPLRAPIRHRKLSLHNRKHFHSTPM